MAYTKKIAKSNKITIDGTDVSESFSDFSYTSEHAEEPAGGFNATGFTEKLPGETTQAFVGTMFYTEQLAAIIEPLHRSRTACTITYQPDGLVDATREIYSGSCYLLSFANQDTFGSVSKAPFAAVPATSAGIAVSNWT